MGFYGFGVAVASLLGMFAVYMGGNVVAVLSGTLVTGVILMGLALLRSERW